MRAGETSEGPSDKRKEDAEEDGGMEMPQGKQGTMVKGVGAKGTRGVMRLQENAMEGWGVGRAFPVHKVCGAKGGKGGAGEDPQEYDYHGSKGILARRREEVEKVIYQTELLNLPQQ